MPAGRVVGTDPGPGDQVVDGGTVTVTLSLGPERYDVPKLKGMTVDEAQDALADTNLVFGTTIDKWSDTVAAGTVMGSTPKQGATLRPDTAVDLIVSRGPKPVEIQSWVGKDADDAIAWLESKGLEGEIVGEEYSDKYAEGDVISQDPNGGTTLHRGDTVELVVSQGPELITVPSVVAQGVEDATEELESLGFEVETEEAPGYLGLGYVFSQDPGGDEQVPKGSTITLYLI